MLHTHLSPADEFHPVQPTLHRTAFDRCRAIVAHPQESIAEFPLRRTSRLRHALLQTGAAEELDRAPFEYSHHRFAVDAISTHPRANDEDTQSIVVSVEIRTDATPTELHV